MRCVAIVDAIGEEGVGGGVGGNASVVRVSEQLDTRRVGKYPTGQHTRIYGQI